MRGSCIGAADEIVMDDGCVSLDVATVWLLFGLFGP